MDWEEQDMTDEDDGVHTVEHPYCDDLTCWCHTDVEYHDWVMHPVYLDSDVVRSYSFYEVSEYV